MNYYLVIVESADTRTLTGTRVDNQYEARTWLEQYPEADGWRCDIFRPDGKRMYRHQLPPAPIVITDWPEPTQTFMIAGIERPDITSTEQWLRETLETGPEHR